MTRPSARRALDLYLLIAVLLGVLAAQQRLNNGITSDGALYFTLDGRCFWPTTY